MKIFKFCLLPVLLLIAAFLAWGATLPSGWEASAEVTIQAQPAAIHAHVEDLADWENWDAWHAKDPAIESSYSGEPGVDMTTEWVDGEGMKGKNVLVESDPSIGVTMNTSIGDFPAFEAVIAYERSGDATIVRWTSSGELPFIVRPVLALLSIGQPDLGEMVSSDYQQGLDQLKTLVEGESAAPAEEQ